jgi:hypothetical protein
MTQLWVLHQQEEEGGFLLIDANNAFNEQNRTGMLWTVRHEWPSGARLYSIVTNTGPRSCFEATMGLAPSFTGKKVSPKETLSPCPHMALSSCLFRLLKVEFPTVEQPWYVDDAGACGKFSEICHFFSKLQEIGPNFGYYPEPTKSILVVPQHNLEAT